MGFLVGIFVYGFCTCFCFFLRLCLGFGVSVLRTRAFRDYDRNRFDFMIRFLKVLVFFSSCFIDRDSYKGLFGFKERGYSGFF